MGDRAQRSEALFAHAGAFQLTLSIVLPDLGVQLHSSYLGHPDAEHSASHLWLASGGPRRWSIEHRAQKLPVAHARRDCLLGHLAVLADQDRGATNDEVNVEVAADALDQVDRA